MPIVCPLTTTPISSRHGSILVNTSNFGRSRRVTYMHIPLDLFADGSDFSWEAIQKGRNQYFQRQLASQIEAKTTSTLALLTSSLNIHLNTGQNLTMNTPSLFMSLETISIQSLSQRTIQQPGSARIQIPPSVQLNSNNHTSVSLRVRHPSFTHRRRKDLCVLVRDATAGFRWECPLSVRH